MTAAAVLDVGSDEQSPSDQIFLYFMCCNVFGWTWQKPAGSPNPLAAIN